MRTLRQSSRSILEIGASAIRSLRPKMIERRSSGRNASPRVFGSKYRSRSSGCSGLSASFE
jgi:hypothetical protein